MCQSHLKIYHMSVMHDGTGKQDTHAKSLLRPNHSTTVHVRSILLTTICNSPCMEKASRRRKWDYTYFTKQSMEPNGINTLQLLQPNKGKVIPVIAQKSAPVALQNKCTNKKKFYFLFDAWGPCKHVYMHVCEYASGGRRMETIKQICNI